MVLWTMTEVCGKKKSRVFLANVSTSLSRPIQAKQNKDILPHGQAEYLLTPHPPFNNIFHTFDVHYSGCFRFLLSSPISATQYVLRPQKASSAHSSLNDIVRL